MSNETQAPAAAPKKKSRRTLMIAVAGLVLLGGGGGAAYWKFAPGHADAAERKAKPKAKHGEAAAEAEHAEAEHDEAEEGPTGIVALEPFVVNLADPGAHALPARQPVARRRERRSTPRRLEENEVATHAACAPRSSNCWRSRPPTRWSRPKGKTELKKAIAEARERSRPRTASVSMSSSPNSLSSSERVDGQRRRLVRRCRHVVCSVDVVLGTRVDVGARVPALRRNSIIRLSESAGADMQVVVNGIADRPR